MKQSIGSERGGNLIAVSVGDELRSACCATRVKVSGDVVVTADVFEVEPIAVLLQPFGVLIYDASAFVLFPRGHFDELKIWKQLCDVACLLPDIDFRIGT
jgi:hypothetical protein